MAAPRYLTRIAGIWRSKSAVTTATADSIVTTDSTGHISIAQMPAGIGPDTVPGIASEALADGNWVNIWDDAGVAKVRKADATAQGKDVDGFVLAAYAATDAVAVYQAGVNTSLTGLAPGQIYYLSTTPGGHTVTAPSTVGNVIQKVGKAASATAMVFERDPATTIDT